MPSHAPSPVPSPEPDHPHMLAMRLLLAVGVVCVAGLGVVLPADAYVGQRLLEWVVHNVVVGIGIVSIVIALAASLFRPEVAKTALYIALVCVVIFFVVKAGSTLEGLLQTA